LRGVGAGTEGDGGRARRSSGRNAGRNRRPYDESRGGEGRSADPRVETADENTRVTGFVFDAGALIAFERADREVVMLVKRLLARGGKVVLPAGVVGQTWRDGARQARLARLLGSPVTVIEPLDDYRARAAGQLCGISGTHDVIDAAVVLSARAHAFPVATS